jgi:hypothetical protein
MDAPFLTTADSSDDRAMEAVWKVHQLIYRLERRQKRLTAPSSSLSSSSSADTSGIRAEIEAICKEVEALAAEHCMPHHLENIWTLVGCPANAELIDKLKATSEVS